MKQNNKIRFYREKAGLTQRLLAEQVGTSQQQIQRLEVGMQSVRFDLALQISQALGQPFEKIFPASRKVIAGLRNKSIKTRDLWENEANKKTMLKAGIDTDPKFHLFKYRLKGRSEEVLPICGSDFERLWSVVQNSHHNQFIVFDSNNHCFAINLSHLLYCHFLYEVHGVYDGSEEVNSSVIEIYFIGDDNPTEFRVDADVADLCDEDASEEGKRVKNLLYYVEMWDGEDRMFHIQDEDGETAFLSAKNISMIKLPLALINAELFEGNEDELAE